MLTRRGDLTAAGSAIWRLDNLRDGRLDLKCRFISSSLFLSGDLRHETRTWIVHPDGLLVVDGNVVRGLAPDERTIAASLQRACMARPAVGGDAAADAEDAAADDDDDDDDDSRNKRKSPDGISFHAGGTLVDVLTQLGAIGGPKAAGTVAPAVLQLHEGGDMITFDALRAALARVEPGSSLDGPGGAAAAGRLEKDRGQNGHEEKDDVGSTRSADADAAPLYKSVVVVIGDDQGFSEADEALLQPVAQRICLGKRPLLASHCAVLLHHYLDQLHSCPSRARPRHDRAAVRRVGPGALLVCGGCERKGRVLPAGKAAEEAKEGRGGGAGGGGCIAFSASQAKKGKARRCVQCRATFDRQLGLASVARDADRQRRRQCAQEEELEPGDKGGKGGSLNGAM